MRKNNLSLMLSIGEAIATTQDWQKLLHIIFERLKDAFNFQLAGIQILNKNKTQLELFVKGTKIPFGSNANFDIHEKINLSETPFEISVKNPRIQKFKIKDLINSPSYSKYNVLKNIIETYNVNVMVHSPLQTGGNVLGFLVLAFGKDEVINAGELKFIQQISNQVAVFLSATLSYAEIVQREKIKDLQLELTNSLVSIKERDQLFKRFAMGIDKIISVNYVGINIKYRSRNESITICFTKEGKDKFVISSLLKNKDIPWLILKSRIKPNASENFHEFNPEEFLFLCQQSAHFRYLKENMNVSSILFINDNQTDDEEINLILAKDGERRIPQMPRIKDPKRFIEREIEFITKLLPQIALVLKNFFAYEEISYLQKQIEQEKNYLLDEINLANNFQEIIGRSAEMQSVLNKVKQVAPLDATVLVLGETGTGKELIARAIHNLSERKDRSLIKVNCTALPAQLIESELFGHEKGSFTGAIERRIGKFELAHGGTIFLDEIGELPLELQSKLLRVLQEQEFERLGGKETIKIDVRIISATNRNLEKEVELGNFRSDLFFRLNVFPLIIPPLRSRKEDIPLFVKYFSEKYSKKVGKPIKSLKRYDLEHLMQYDWPGNIRELEHLIERAVIISNSSNLQISEIMSSKYSAAAPDISTFKTLPQVEKEHIIAALRAANGRVTGEKGAAKILGINGKTLGSKMRKFGIRKEITISS